jgi:hypothetical protein
VGRRTPRWQVGSKSAESVVTADRIDQAIHRARKDSYTVGDIVARRPCRRENAGWTPMGWGIEYGVVWGLVIVALLLLVFGIGIYRERKL